MQNTTTVSDVTITARAAEEIRSLRAEHEVPEECALRLGARIGGCSGPSYSLGFDSERQEDDVVLESGGITVLVDPGSMLLLAGTELDYSDAADAGGFVFSNPNAGCNFSCSSCGS
jgi:iron-sulfur cluster assembly protein